MRWDYSSLSLIMWIALALYVGLLAVLFKYVSEGINKKKAFNSVAVGLVGVHVILLASLGLNDSAASLKKVGFEAWVCGKQIQIADNSPTGRIFRDGGYFSEKTLTVNNDEVSLSLGKELKSAGLEYSDSSVTAPVSNNFELKVGGDTSLDWLKSSLQYPSSSNQPSLVIENAKLVCPSGGAGSWNVFVASVNNETDTYSWKKVSLEQLSLTSVRASDGDDLPDCVVMDYDLDKENPEYRCADLLKRDAKRCPDEDKSNCTYKEVQAVKVEDVN